MIRGNTAAARWPLLFGIALGCAGSKPANDPSGLPRGTASDIRDARAKHEAALSAFGRWEDDPSFVTRWCPREPPPGEARFEAFRNYGHWAAKSGPSALDTAMWATARPGTWLETTTKTGWWIYRQASDEWCWIPGVLDAHIAWRKGLFYVGWAPMTPTGRLEDIPDRAWTYTMLGVLYDSWLTTLIGDARTDAFAATKPQQGQGAPSVEEVATARRECLQNARDAGMASGNDLPPAQALWALIIKPSAKPAPSASTVSQGNTNPLQGIPGMEGMGALQGLLGGDGGMPMMPTMPLGN